MHKHISLVLALALLGGCSHQPSAKFEEALTAGRCDDALEHIPKDEAGVKFIGRTNRVAGNALSYTATGAGYAADVVLTVVGGAVVVAVLCAPGIAMALSTRTYASTEISPCLPADLSKLPYPHNGRDTYSATEELRCPDLTAIARQVRRVATCQEKSGGMEAMRKARTTLRSVATSESFMTCIVASEKAAIEQDLARLERVAGND